MRLVFLNDIRGDSVMLNRHHWLPAEPEWVLDGVQLGCAGAVEDSVEPIVAFEPFGGAVFVFAEGDDAHASPALDLDEADPR